MASFANARAVAKTTAPLTRDCHHCFQYCPKGFALRAVYIDIAQASSGDGETVLAGVGETDLAIGATAAK